MKNLFFFVLYTIWNPRLLSFAFKGAYLPVFVQYEWTRKYKIKTFIDVGANKGRVVDVFRAIFPGIKVYAFEPEKKEFESLNKKGVEAFNVALSKSSGKAKFYSFPEYSPASSLKKPPGEYEGKFGGAESVTVSVDTLDNLLRDKLLEELVFLKVDTQGSEYEVLKGARVTLKKVGIIHIEMSTTEHYKNQKNFDMVYRLLIDNGFRFAGVIPDGDFVPSFTPQLYVNAIFYNPRKVNLFKK